MSNVFFTSDPHYGHKNIIDYCNRPFKHVDDMNDQLIANHNAVVTDADRVYMLGDIVFLSRGLIHSVLQRLNGQKYLIFGNHDKAIRKEEFRQYFAWTGDYKEIKVENQHIVLMHYSMRTWNRQGKGSWQLYGHSHNTLPEDPNLLSMDVGVDAHDFRPVSFEQVRERMEKKKRKMRFFAQDHHRREL